ncbi:MAG TPA: hypothetical protein VGB53_00815 [Rubricoccaceae bacterium]|jgi:hypothetical protein
MTTAPPPDASEAVERMAERLRTDAAGLSALRLSAANVHAHEASDRLPLVLVQQTDRPGSRVGAAAGVATAVEVDVLVEVLRTSKTTPYNPRRALAAIHRWAFVRLSGTDVDAAAETPLQHAAQLLPIVGYTGPDTPQTDAKRGSLFSIASFVLTLQPRTAP